MTDLQAAALDEPVPIVAPKNFVLATRDTGYRSLSAAIAELVDNSLQASARKVRLFAHHAAENDGSIVIGVLDDGKGMSAELLGAALQFGGTDRFGDRTGLGRFGMGLPNSSVSHSRRFEVYSWQRDSRVLYSYLDVDEIVSGRMRGIPVPQARSLPRWLSTVAGRSGTLVLWTRCDRLGRFRLDTLVQRLLRTLGQLYRYSLWSGIRITVNDKPVPPFDPLFLDTRAALHGGKPYGTPLRYEVKCGAGTSVIEVRFAELPVAQWQAWQADDKRRRGIVGSAGVSVVRAGREIDYGWHLLGGKRRENYDDWWRCEIRFAPALDELFGVTHSKQGVNPRAELKLLLGADLEVIARTLNRRVREAFEHIKRDPDRPSAVTASRNDELLSPPASLRSRTFTAGGLKYRLRYQQIPSREFYGVRVLRDSVVVTINTDHPFFSEIYRRASRSGGCDLEDLERLLLAAARADLEARNSREREFGSRLRRAWSDALAAFLRP
jgi:hypothetical protein